MTPATLLNTLKALPKDAPLVFQTAHGAIGSGYHVTEYKLASVSSIDCGGRLSNWTEAALQLLDGVGGEYMTAGKFNAILAQSISKVNGLADTPLHVEFAHQNEGLRIYQIETPELIEGVISFPLSEDRAHCKPALETIAHAKVSGCCGSSAAASCCN